MRKTVLPAIIVVLAVTLFMRFGRARLSGHKFELKTYIQDANCQHEGAPVRLAGVDIGTVSNVRADPSLRDSEILMTVTTPYELKIPNDATVSLATAGVLGERFVEIDVRNATGAPLVSGGVLKAKMEAP